MGAQIYRVTWSTEPKRLQNRCMIKISRDGEKTWWPPGPYELHVAGEVYVLMMDGRYEKRSD